MGPQCNLIIDSCCDLPISCIDKEGVTIIQFPYVMDGVEHSDDLYQTTSAKEFYDAMRDKKRSFPSTTSLRT